MILHSLVRRTQVVNSVENSKKRKVLLKKSNNNNGRHKSYLQCNKPKPGSIFLNPWIIARLFLSIIKVLERSSTTKHCSLHSKDGSFATSVGTVGDSILRGVTYESIKPKPVERNVMDMLRDFV